VHDNLYAYGDDDEIYKALQRDYKRDAKQTTLFDTLAAAVGVMAVADIAEMRGWWLFIAATLALSAHRTFIDNSNRNWYMHRLDRERARRP